VAPSLSIGAVLLQQAAAAAAFHYNHVEIIESQEDLSVSGCTERISLFTSSTEHKHKQGSFLLVVS